MIALFIYDVILTIDKNRNFKFLLAKKTFYPKETFKYCCWLIVFDVVLKNKIVILPWLLIDP